MHRKSLWRRLIGGNALWFLGALVCTVACVILDYLIPLVLGYAVFMHNQKKFVLYL